MEDSKKLYLHPPLLEGVTIGLKFIFEEREYTDKVINILFKERPKWGARDRGMVAESIYELVRWWRLYWFLIDKDPAYDTQSLGLLVGAWAKRNEVELPKIPLFNSLSLERLDQRFQIAKTRRAIALSVPDWLDAFGVEELGEEKWALEMSAMNFPAPIVLRTNTLQTDKISLKNYLQQEGWESGFSPLAEEALVMQKRGNLFKSTGFKDGWFEMQDAGSQHISHFLNIKPGMLVVDACAGAGGKTLHIASLLQNKGRVIAMDTEKFKLEELKRRGKRNGASNIEARLIDSTKAIKRLENKADRLLLDVPCSGIGVLRRNPDAKWKLTMSFIKEVQLKQKEILQSYSKMVKTGGQIVYATCSLLPSENQNQVKSFLENNSEFSLDEEKTLFPSEGQSDGFYMARLVKNG